MTDTGKGGRPLTPLARTSSYARYLAVYVSSRKLSVQQNCLSRMARMESLDIATVIGVLVKDFVTPPDYSELMKDICQNHADDFVELHKFDAVNPVCPGATKPLPELYKILFTTSDAIIVQELEKSWNRTRFEVRKIEAGEWDDYFVGWLAPGDDKYGWLGTSSWVDGMRMYGANV